MFKIFDRKKNQIDLLENPISPVIVNELGGIGELSFSVPSTYKHLELEGYIQVENDHEYVIKEIVTHGTNREVVCTLNIEEILGMAWSKFISRENTLMKCAELVLSGTGWRAINKSSCTVSRNLYGTVTNSYNLLQMMCTVYNVEFIFDTYNKTVTFVDKVGKDAGVYFINDINLKQLNIDTHTHKYITRVIPIGKEGLTIESVNGGKNYLENKTYSNKNIYGIWQSDKHDNPSALKADAQRFLDEMAIPYETYEVLVDDLYALRGIESFKYELGDIVTIIDGETETRVQQRVIQRTYNLLEPDKDTLHIANKDATFEDYYKRLQTIADMTQSVIGSDGTISGGSISDGTVTGDKLQTDSITSSHIKAEQILADHIMSNQITSNHIVANNITTDHIQANSIDTKHLKANIISSDHIQANTINANHITTGAITAGSGIIADGAIGSAQISSLDASKVNAGTIDTSKVTIQGTNGHLKLKGNRMQVFDGIGNQAKERVSVGDVNGDGTVFGLRVRGKDGTTVLLDENGVTSEGITDGSITNDKVADNANIDGAKLNIDSVITHINEDGTEVIKGTKIEVNGTNLGVKLSEITNKQTTDSERITQAQSQITANQNAIKLKVDTQTYTSDKNNMTSKLEKNTSDISAMKGQIALKVEKTDIDNIKNELEGTLDTKISNAKSEIKVTTDSIAQQVGKLETTTTTLSGKVDTANSNASKAQTLANTANENANSALSQISTTNSKVTSLETNLNGITSRVGNVETKTTTLEGKVTSHESRLATAESKITDSAITNVVKKEFYTKSETEDVITNKGYQTSSQVQQTVDALQIKFQESGGYNLLYNGDFKRKLQNWTQDVTNGFGWSDGLSCKNGRGVYSRGELQYTKALRQQNIPLDVNEDAYTLSFFQYTTPDGADGTTNPYRTIEVAVGYTDGTWSYHSVGMQTNFGVWERKVIRITRPSGKHFQKANVGLWCRDTTKMVYYSQIVFEEGTLATQWTPNPNEVHDGITTIDKNGIIVTSTSSSTYTEMDADSFRVSDNNGGTVAEFSKSSIIPNLTAGTINATNVYATNIPTKEPYGSIHFVYVNGSTGNDTNNGTQNSPYKTVQRAIEDISDIQNTNITIYVYGSVPGFTLRGTTGSGQITFSMQNDAVVSGNVYIEGVNNRVWITNESSSRKPTFQKGISIYRCQNVEMYYLTFRGLAPETCNVYIKDTNMCAINSCDFGGLSTELTCAVKVQTSLLWIYGCIGSNIRDVVGQYAFSHVMMQRAGTGTVPDYKNGIMINYDGAGRIQNWAGGTFTKTPSSGWNPSYTPTQKTQVWSFNKIWSDETLNGWSDRQELIQGYSSTWSTGRWTGYMQMTDGMTGIRNTISGGTNLSGRIYVQRTSSSGNSTGSKLCLYASDGTLITNSTTINRSQGVWVSLSSAIISKIQSGAITYFYLKADANNDATYFKCQSNAKIEITYTK